MAWLNFWRKSRAVYLGFVADFCWKKFWFMRKKLSPHKLLLVTQVAIFRKLILLDF